MFYGCDDRNMSGGRVRRRSMSGESGIRCFVIPLSCLCGGRGGGLECLGWQLLRRRGAWQATDGGHACSPHAPAPQLLPCFLQLPTPPAHTSHLHQSPLATSKTHILRLSLKRRIAYSEHLRESACSMCAAFTSTAWQWHACMTACQAPARPPVRDRSHDSIR